MIILKLVKELLGIILLMSSISGETCHRFRPKRGITVDPHACQLDTFAGKQESFLCTEVCLTRQEVGKNYTL